MRLAQLRAAYPPGEVFLHHGRLGHVVVVRQVRAFVAANEIHRGVVGKVALTYVPVVRSEVASQPCVPARRRSVAGA